MFLCTTTSRSSLTPRFKATPLGKNTLGTMIKRMCEKAGISGGYTSHSLRAYGATTLFHAQVPEKLIQQRPFEELKDITNYNPMALYVYGSIALSSELSITQWHYIRMALSL